MDKKEYFSHILKLAERKYGKMKKRLAGESWKQDWQTLIATIMSAQSRDETTIPIAEDLFARYKKLDDLAEARYDEVLNILKRLNYNKTKTKNIIAAAKFIIENYQGCVPNEIDKLLEIPGVGRKTANLVLSEIHGKDAICIDTHCHRLLNVLGIVHTKTPAQTEFAMMEISPKKYWSRINRILVLWGKDVRGRDKKKLLDELNNGI